MPPALSPNGWTCPVCQQFYPDDPHGLPAIITEAQGISVTDVLCRACLTRRMEAKRNLAIARARLEMSGLSGALNYRFEDFNAEADPSQQRALFRAQEMLRAIQLGRWENLWLYSLPPELDWPAGQTVEMHNRKVQAAVARGETGMGCGKSHLALALAREAILIGKQVIIWSMPNMFGELRACYQKDSTKSDTEIIREMQKAELLVLDDLGAESYVKEDWYQEIMFKVINAREAFRRWTVITSNLTPQAVYERVGARSESRLHMLFPKPLQVRGPDLRKRS